MELAGGIDGTTMYETKYFLNQEKKRASVAEVAGSQGKDGAPGGDPKMTEEEI